MEKEKKLIEIHKAKAIIVHISLLCNEVPNNLIRLYREKFIEIHKTYIILVKKHCYINY